MCQRLKLANEATVQALPEQNHSNFEVLVHLSYRQSTDFASPQPNSRTQLAWQSDCRGKAHPGSTKERHRSSTGQPSTTRGPAERLRPEPTAPQEAASFSRVAPRPASTRFTSKRSTERPAASLWRNRHRFVDLIVTIEKPPCSACKIPDSKSVHSVFVPRSKLRMLQLGPPI